MPLLEVKNLEVAFKTRGGIVRAVNSVSYTLEAGRTLGIVGESGSGKSVSAMSILGLLDRNGYIAGGEIWFDGVDLTKLDDESLRRIRGNRISVIFQEPMTSLNPVFSIRKQLSEPFVIHGGMTKKEAYQKCVEALRAVRIPSPESVARQYPHQLSGGMRQRVMIAMALAASPDILIADEPTTALDVTVQAEILRLMQNLQRDNGTAILFITHDLGVINEMADDVAVMYFGQVVELTSAKTLFTDCPVSHPYTEGLMLSVPRLDGVKRHLTSIPGSVPQPFERIDGCKFSPRCPYATEKCLREEPLLLEVRRGQAIRCFYPEKEVRRREEHKKIAVNQEFNEAFSAREGKSF